MKPTNTIERGVKIGENVFIGGYVYIRKGTVIGDNVAIGHNTVIEENVTIGNNVRIQSSCNITKGTIIEDSVFIAPGVKTSNDMYICSHGRPEKSTLKAPLIKRGARIGVGSILAPEVVIGENAFIGAGSLVLKDVPANEMWYGHPAKRIREIPEDEKL
jgi:acetyltransferase-like isoleucine patch superfamily enzyme